MTLHSVASDFKQDNIMYVNITGACFLRLKEVRDVTYKLFTISLHTLCANKYNYVAFAIHFPFVNNNKKLFKTNQSPRKNLKKN